MEKNIVSTAPWIVMVEMYRIAHKNLANANDGQNDFNNFKDIDIKDGMDFSSLGTGAVGVDGDLNFRPSLAGAVQEGDINKLLKQLPWPLSKIKFSKNNSVSNTDSITYYDTTSHQQRVRPPNGYQDNLLCELCHPKKYNTADGCTTVTLIKLVKRTKEKTANSTLEDNSDTDKKVPMPMELKKGWEQVTHVCALAFRFKKEKALSEGLVNGDKMLPGNFALAEAELYDPKRGQNALSLFSPTWQARLTPVSLHKKLIDKLGISIDNFSDKLLLH
jgi:hypothetical protein